MDVQTIKNMKTTPGKKSQLGFKSEVADFNTEKQLGNKRMGKSSNISSNVSDKSAMVCRICLDYDNNIQDYNDTKFNPMISPCHCSGTMGGIHLKCLREWLERNKTMKAVKGHVIIKYKKVNCELCK